MTVSPTAKVEALCRWPAGLRATLDALLELAGLHGEDGVEPANMASPGRLEAANEIARQALRAIVLIVAGVGGDAAGPLSRVAALRPARFSIALC